ncbi:MAG: undecaprenyl-diphosphate phosphatase [Actinomycetota bacterium]
MSLLQAVVLGAVQGLTEFIPISSSGHLVLVPEALGWSEPGLAFDVFLHSASLVALLAYFAGDLIDLVRGVVARDRDSMRLFGLLVVGTIPAVIAALAFEDFFEDAFEEPSAAAVLLLVTAAVLVSAELILRRHESRSARAGGSLRDINDLKYRDAGVVGVAQAFAILPGISRSGATIGAGLGLKMARDDAARFAFLLAIPALIGASLVQIPELGSSEIGPGAALGGFAASLVTSYAAIAGLIRYLKTRTLYPFAVYCIIASGIFSLLVS